MVVRPTANDSPTARHKLSPIVDDREGVLPSPLEED